MILGTNHRCKYRLKAKKQDKSAEATNILPLTEAMNHGNTTITLPI